MTIEVMMPYYGDPSQFRDAVKSVLAQSSAEWRLTVIDDCYPDPEPGLWVSGLDDLRVRYIRNTENIGVMGNFQRAIEESTEEHVVIMGCDDLMRPNYISRMNDLILQFPKAAYYQPGVHVIDDQGRESLPLGDRMKAILRPKKREAAVLHGEELAAGLLHGNWTYFPSICWRRNELVRWGFRREYQVVLDLALQLDIIMAGGSLVLSPEVTFDYRRHSASVSSWTASNGERFDEEAALFEHAAKRADVLGWRHAAKAARRHWTSRLNAATNVPAALRHHDRSSLRALLRHTFR